MKRSNLIWVLPLLVGLRTMVQFWDRPGHASAQVKDAAASSIPCPNQAVDITESGFDSFTQQSGKVVLVEFHANWCDPCKEFAPCLDRVVAEFSGSVVLGRIDVDACKALVARQGVKGVPDLRFYRNGQMVHQYVGTIDEASLRQMVGSLVDDLAAAQPTPAVSPPAPPQKKSDPGAITPMQKDWLPPGVQKR